MRFLKLSLSNVFLLIALVAASLAAGRLYLENQRLRELYQPFIRSPDEVASLRINLLEARLHDNPYSYRQQLEFQIDHAEFALDTERPLASVREELAFEREKHERFFSKFYDSLTEDEKADLEKSTEEAKLRAFTAQYKVYRMRNEQIKEVEQTLDRLMKGEWQEVEDEIEALSQELVEQRVQRWQRKYKRQPWY